MAARGQGNIVSVNVAGIDAGFVHTGWAIVRMHSPEGGEPGGDELLEVGVLKSVSCEPSSPAPGYSLCLSDSVVYSDAGLCVRLMDGLCRLLKKWDVKAAFVELPSGGSQGARAGRCMGMSTALVVTLLRMFQYYKIGPIHNEIYAPSDVEKALGIHLSAGDARGMKKGARAKWKKERMREAAMRGFPAFEGWPEVKNDTQDAFDAVAAFLCGKKRNMLYADLRRW